MLLHGGGGGLLLLVAVLLLLAALLLGGLALRREHAQHRLHLAPVAHPAAPETTTAAAPAARQQISAVSAREGLGGRARPSPGSSCRCRAPGGHNLTHAFPPLPPLPPPPPHRVMRSWVGPPPGVLDQG